MFFSTHTGVRGPRFVALFAASAMFLSLMPVFLVTLPAQAAHSGDPLDKSSTAATNPDLVGACGLDILFVLDETGSMGDEEEELVDAVQAFRASLEGTLSRIGIIEFSSLPETGDTEDPTPGQPQSARLVTNGFLDPANAILTGYQQVDGVSAANTDSYNADGYTSWQEGLWKASEFATADLLIFFTDGNPNTVDGDSHVTSPSYHGYGNAEATEAAEFAATYANIIKNAGTHILGMGLGFNSAQASRLALVSGPQGVSLPNGTFDVETTDYVTFSDPDDIATALEEVSNQLCSTTFNITKWVPSGPNYDFGQGTGFEKASGWTFDLSNPIVDGGSVWVDAPPASTSGGTVTFKWQNNVRGNSASVDLSETLKSGWDVLGGSCSIDGGDAIPLSAAAALGTISNIPDRSTVDCDVFNHASFLSLNKKIIDDDGGSAVPGDFTVSASGPASFSGPANQGPYLVPAGDYEIAETPVSGWTPQGWVCDNNAKNSGTSSTANITLPVGAHVICTITNDDVKPTLTLKKVVNHTYGGDAVASDWTLMAKEGLTVVLSGVSGVSGQVAGGTYDLTESGPASYSLVGWSCDNGDNQGAVTLASGDDVTCTATNDSKPAGLKLVKKVAENNFGATASATDWNLAADGPGGNDFNGNGTAENTTLPAGNYALSESGGPEGWTAGEWACDAGSYDADNDTVTLGIGVSATCTITNSAIQPRITLHKRVQSGNGGTATYLDFLLGADHDNGQFSISGYNDVGDNGDSSVIDAAVLVGKYTLSETANVSGYAAAANWVCIADSGVFNGADELILGAGQHADCTITNTENPAALTVRKVVNNSYGGQLGVDDFTLMVDQAVVAHNVPIDVLSNKTYVISEDLTGMSGYHQDGQVSCIIGDGDPFDLINGNLILAEGQEAVCTITNVDEPGSITVIKEFAHDTNAQPDDFKLTIDGQPVISGEKNELDGDASYAVDETVLEGWTQVSLTCSDTRGAVDNPVALAVGQDVTCTITNGEIPTITVDKIAIGDDETTFNFTGDVSDFSFDQNGGSKTFQVEPGEYVVTETPAEFWALTGIECEGGAAADLNTASGNFEVDLGDHQKCTFTNERLPESIEVLASGVCLAVTPYLQWTVNPINFSGTDVDITWLDLDPQDPLYQSLGNPLQGQMLWPGIVLDGDQSIVDWPGWIFQDGRWFQGDDGYQDTIPTASVMFTVNPQVVVLVDYADCGGPPAKIIVEKEVLGDSSKDLQFTFDTVGFELDDNTLAHGQQGFSGPLSPGDGYSVSEVVPDGWLPAVATCDDGSDPANIDLEVGETVTCTFQNEVETEVLASVLVTVGGSCVLSGDEEIGQITVTISVDDGATVVIKDGNTVIDTLTQDGVVNVSVGKTYTWEATASSDDNFEFPPGFVASGQVEVGLCSLPFTGLFADDLAALAIGLTLAGMLAVAASRRRRDEDLDH